MAELQSFELSLLEDWRFFFGGFKKKTLHQKGIKPSGAIAVGPKQVKQAIQKPAPGSIDETVCEFVN